MHVRLEQGGRLRDSAQPCKIENLQAVVARAVGHDVGVVSEGFDVAPDGRGRGAPGLRKVADQDRVQRIRDIHEGRPVRAANECIFAAGVGVGPSPVVIHAHTAGVLGGTQHIVRKERQELYFVAVEGTDLAVHTRSFFARQGR